MPATRRPDDRRRAAREKALFATPETKNWAGADYAQLARSHGKKRQITFWGEMGPPHRLPSGTPADIERSVDDVHRPLRRIGGRVAQCEFGPAARLEYVSAEIADLGIATVETRVHGRPVPGIPLNWRPVLNHRGGWRRTDYVAR